MRILEITLAIFLIVTIYLLPTGIAMLRRKKNKAAIFVVNLFLGWLLIGWVVALAWAFMKD